MKKRSRVCTQEEPRDLRVAIGGTRVKHAGELKVHTSCYTIGQNSQAGKAVSSRLIPVASLTHQNALFVRNLTVLIPH